MGGCLAYHETRLFKKTVSGWVPKTGSSPDPPRALPFSMRVPLSLQLTRHWGQLVRSARGMFPHSSCYDGDKKVKSKPQMGLVTILLVSQERKCGFRFLGRISRAPFEGDDPKRRDNVPI